MKINYPGIRYDEDAFIAAVDLVDRTGATAFQVGWLHDDVPPAEAGWYVYAQYRSARITVDDQPGPVEAATTLAEKLLTGARCVCGRLVALSDRGAIAYDSPTMTDGSKWSAAEAATAGQCRWRRIGRRWTSECRTQASHDPGT